MRVDLGGPHAGAGGGGGGGAAPPRVSCTILVNGDGTLTVQAGAVGVTPGNTAAVVVADPLSQAPNAIQLTFDTPFNPADYAFEGACQGIGSVYANGQCYELPADAGTRLGASITFYIITSNGFLDVAAGTVGGYDFGVPITVSVFCG